MVFRNLNVSQIIRLLLAVGVFVIVARDFQISTRPSIKEYISPHASFRYFHFGFKYQLSDLLWLRAVQDLDFCEKRDADRNCTGKVWLFEVLNLTTLFDPWYRMVYAGGALGLSVVVSDIKGASSIFNRGIQHYPHDWVILYKAAYHAVYEEKNKLKGARLLEQAARSGAPEWVYALASRIYSEQGEKELGLRILKDAESLSIPPSILKEVQKRLSP